MKSAWAVYWDLIAGIFNSISVWRAKNDAWFMERSKAKEDKAKKDREAFESIMKEERDKVKDS